MTFGLSKQRRRAIVGIAAVIYGLGVAFGGAIWGDDAGGPWLMIGAFIVGALFLVLMVIPWFTVDRAR